MSSPPRSWWIAVALAALAGCSDDEQIPPIIDAAIDAPPPIDAPVVDAPIDAVDLDAPDVDAPTAIACVPSVTALTVNEGASALITVTLSARPQGTQTCAVVAGDVAVVTISPASLAFMPAGWDQPQTLTVAGVQDVDAVDDSTTLSITTTGAPAAAVAVAVVDDD